MLLTKKCRIITVLYFLGLHIGSSTSSALSPQSPPKSIERRKLSPRGSRDAKHITALACSLGVVAGIYGIDNIQDLKEWESTKTLLKSLVAAVGFGCNFYLSDERQDAWRISKKALILGLTAALVNNRYFVNFCADNPVLKIFVDKGFRSINNAQIEVEVAGFGTAARNLLPYMILSYALLNEEHQTIIAHLEEEEEFVKQGGDEELLTHLNVSREEMQQALHLTQRYFRSLESEHLFEQTPAKKLPLKNEAKQ